MKILAVDRHRNGSGLEWGFYVVIVEDPLPDAPGRFLYVQFNSDEQVSNVEDCVMAINLDKAHER